MVDLSGLRQTEQELRLAHEKLRGYADQLEKRVAERTRELEETNAEMQAFSYSVSHDLRAPLRAMQGFSQALLEDFGPGLGEIGQDYARRIASSAAHMDSLIQDLLAYSRLSRAEIRLVPVGLQEAADEALQQVQSAVREHGASVDVRRPLPLVRAHRGTLVQILANLLGNAVKFHPAGAAPSVSLWAESRDRLVRVWVEDNGIGVPSEHRERIFRAFERLHGAEQYQGTGIGLAIVRKGAERMGGRAGVEARAGGGSRFWIELRAREEA